MHQNVSRSLYKPEIVRILLKMTTRLRNLHSIHLVELHVNKILAYNCTCLTGYIYIYLPPHLFQKL